MKTMNLQEFNYEGMVARNFPLISKESQKLLSEVTIAIAGLGAEGSILAETLARLGFCNFYLTDPDRYEISNFNRQNGANLETLGRNKAMSVAELLLLINPDIKLRVFSEGLNFDNTGGFITNATLVIDALDFEERALSILLNKKARQLRLATFSGVSVGYGANMFVFSPEKEAMTLLEFLKMTPFSWVPHLPSYISKEELEKVIKKGNLTLLVQICYYARYVSTKSNTN